MTKVFLVLFHLSILLAACGGSAATSQPPEDAALAPVPTEYAGLSNPLGPESAGEGAALFETNCATCHGPQGHGDGPAGQSLNPRPKDLAGLQARAGDDFLFWRIHDGKPGTSMVAWRGILTDEQIWQLVAYIRTLE